MFDIDVSPHTLISARVFHNNEVSQIMKFTIMKGHQFIELTVAIPIKAVEDAPKLRQLFF